MTVQEQERRARERLRNLEKARRVKARKRAAAERAEAQRRRRERASAARRARELSERYDRALAKAVAFGDRPDFTDAERRAWDRVHSIGNQLRAAYTTQRLSGGG
jgi:hypothetical protein